MKLGYPLRILLDLIMTILLLVGFSYYWLGNTIHELLGTGFFLFLIIHNLSHSNWYKSIKRKSLTIKEQVNMVSIFLLLITFTVLLVTSFLISKAQYDVLGINGGFLSKQIHSACSYWIIIIVSIHLGLRWELVMSLPKRFFKINFESKIKNIILRIISIFIAYQGIKSSSTLGVGGKLLMRMSLDWWSFEESVMPFFLHLMAISGLYIFITYYLIKLLMLAEEVRKKKMLLLRHLLRSLLQ